jgi:hypothetical protein
LFIGWSIHDEKGMRGKVFEFGSEEVTALLNLTKKIGLLLDNVTTSQSSFFLSLLHKPGGANVVDVIM